MNERELAAACDGNAGTPLLQIGLRLLGKDVSVGEYDVASGLTYVTRQRGRLHFHMGVNALKTAASSMAASDGDNRSGCRGSVNAAGDSAAPTTDALAFVNAHARAPATPSLRTGAFTGLALYPEEAYYLLQRGALVVFELEASPSQTDAVSPAEAPRSAQVAAPTSPLQALSTVRFVELLLRRQQASLACLDAYVSLKEHQFHPRRPERDAPAYPGTSMNTQGAPRHYDPSVDNVCNVAFDVWKLSTETIYIPNSDHKAVRRVGIDTQLPPATGAAEAQKSEIILQSGATVAPPEQATSIVRELQRQHKKQHQQQHKRKTEKRAMMKRKVKRLQLAFRVVVCRFTDAIPPAHALAPLGVSICATAPRECETEQQRQHATSSSDPLRSSMAHVPVKLAVVDTDRSVLFFEVA